MATSQSLSSSKGIFAGFLDEMYAKSVFVDNYSNVNTSLVVTWERMDSDFPIIENFVAIVDRYFVIDHDLSCKENLANQSIPDDHWTKYEQAQMHNAGNLSLNHGHDYWAVVYAYDLAGHCAMNISQAIRIDQTPPTDGQVHIGKRTGELSYVADRGRVHISWDGFDDLESGIKLYRVGLQRMPDCSSADYSKMTTVFDYQLLLTSDTNDTFVEFEQLQLESNVPYYVGFVAENNAGLATEAWSTVVFVDDTPPIAGDVKDGSNFETDEAYTNRTDELWATLTLVHHPDHVACAISRNVTFTDGDMPDGWTITDQFVRKRRKNKKENYLAFTKEMIELGDDGIIFHVKQDLRNKRIQSGMVQSDSEPLMPGPYTMFMKAANGYQIISSMVVTADEIAELLFDYPIVDDPLGEKDFDTAESFSENNVDAANGGYFITN